MIESDHLPTLVGERVLLRWLEEPDVPALFELFSDPKATRHWSWPAYVDVAQARELLRQIRDQFRAHDLYQWGLARRSADQVVGTCTLAGLDRNNQRAEIGFVLRSDCWRQGLMTDALQVLIDFAFDSLDLQRLEADVDPENAPSLNLLERLGFVREGFMRERWLVDGERRDTVFLGLLRRDWSGRSRTG